MGSVPHGLGHLGYGGGRSPCVFPARPAAVSHNGILYYLAALAGLA